MGTLPEGLVTARGGRGPRPARWAHFLASRWSPARVPGTASRHL